MLGCNSIAFYAEKRNAFWLRTSDNIFLPAAKIKVPEVKYEIHASGSVNYSASWTGVKKTASLKAEEHSSLVLELAMPPGEVK
jgi:hypothetical protein